MKVLIQQRLKIPPNHLRVATLRYKTLMLGAVFADQARNLTYARQLS